MFHGVFGAGRASGPANDTDDAPIVLSFRGERLASCTGEGAVLSAIPKTGAPWAKVLCALDLTDPGLQSALGNLIAAGEPFRYHFRHTSQLVLCAEGRTRGLFAELSIGPAPAPEAALFATFEKRLIECEAKAAEAWADAAPIAILESAADGSLLRLNAAAESLVPNLDSVADLPAPSAVPAFVAAAGRWLRVSATAPGGAVRTWYLEDLDAQIRAEQALESFTSALTETFAHLGSALAVFDHERRLSVFNPALADLFDLRPAALAGRPSFREFLDALRQGRNIPEPSDFPSWRTRLLDAVEKADRIPFQEDWPLPSGQILRVTARPHPRGALAFLFEDISQTVSLERRFRSEIEQGQAILDRLSEAIAVFTASGALAHVNASFAEALGFDPFTSHEPPSLAVILDTLATRLGHAPGWAGFREFALSGDVASRADTWAWPDLPTAAPGAVNLRGNRLPDGLTLLSIERPGLRPAEPQKVLAETVPLGARLRG